MNRIKTTIVVSIISIAWLAASGAYAQDTDTIHHASPELIQLAEEFRNFRSPLFRARTWLPTHQVIGIPDYAAVKKEQIEGLTKFRQSLNAIDHSDWPIHDQVDYLVLRSEMDDVYFEQHVLREVETNAGYYIEQAVNGVASKIPSEIPFSV